MILPTLSPYFIPSKLQSHCHYFQIHIQQICFLRSYLESLRYEFGPQMYQHGSILTVSFIHQFYRIQFPYLCDAEYYTYPMG